MINRWSISDGEAPLCLIVHWHLGMHRPGSPFSPIPFIKKYTLFRWKQSLNHPTCYFFGSFNSSFHNSYTWFIRSWSSFILAKSWPLCFSLTNSHTLNSGISWRVWSLWTTWLKLNPTALNWLRSATISRTKASRDRFLVLTYTGSLSTTFRI